MLVLANTYGDKDPSQLHENITSWDSGCISDAVDLLDRLCRSFDEDNEVGWKGRSKVDWFFSPTDNMQEIAHTIATQLKEIVVEGGGLIRTPKKETVG